MFFFFRAHSRLFGSQSRLQINFSSDYGPETKGTKKPYLTCMSLFRHDYRILKLRIICRGTKSVLICKSSVYFRAPYFVCCGNGTRQIVILKTKIMPVSINAAANCNEHIVEADDAMPTLRNVHDRITQLICRQMISCYTLPNIFSYYYPYIFFCKCHERNLVWNWSGSMEDCLTFHS